ncbi:biopolymer transporter ExbB [Stenotrophomonas ginsengisoli]|uniref:Biopolymer transport protein ExbB n=1 Tax=Stenotrophomonas ginsengisoli TaxID=336566 RepID=A0A0R0DML1_9GAMM|nr:TonB-system energizer ExbB [Stenotrophomonas ginsengisoli]KRG79284.1 biopolymer transporter ExbB [Stenotrophomonas ginsengisoli]
MLQETFIAAAGGANALSQMGFEHMMAEMVSKPGDFAVSWIVFLVLVFMSAASWYWTVINIFRSSRLKAAADRVPAKFWDAPNAQAAISAMEEEPASEPFSKIALDAAQAAAHHSRVESADGLSRSEFVDRALRQAVVRETDGIQGGMILLATVGATAPFVGLLGTVWGIYGALIKIGATGSASIDAVAGPVGEALIMTAIGLFVAIPAVFAFNFFSKMNNAVVGKFDSFAHDLHDFFATGSRVR